MPRHERGPASTGPGALVVNGRFLADRMTGVQRYAFELTRALVPALAARGRPLLVLAPGGALSDKASELPVVQDHSALRGYAWEQLALPRSFRAAAGALLFSPANVGPWGVRQQLLTIHDAAVFAHPEWFDWRFRVANRLFLPRLAHRVRHVLTDSTFSAQELSRHGVAPADRLTVIAPGAPRLAGPGDAAGGGGGAGRPRSGPPGPYILSVSTLEPRKNLTRLLAAWGLAQQHPTLRQFTLVVAGAAQWLFKDERFAERASDRVRFVGYLADAELGAYYRHAAAVVYVPLYEGFGLPPLEAMAAQVPVLASEIPPLREVCGDAALYCSPWSVTEIAAGLTEIIGNAPLRARLRELGERRRAELTWERAAERLAGLIDRLAPTAA